MESYKSGKGSVISKDNYTQSSQIRNRNCGKLCHFARNWPTKKRNNGVQFKPQNPQKFNWGQRPITEIWADGSIMSNFKPHNKCCHEIARKISASKLHEGFSSRVADFCGGYSTSASDSSEDYSSSASDFSEDYSSPASDSYEDCSSSDLSDYFAAYSNQFEDYFSSAPESSPVLHSPGVSSSLMSDSSHVSSSSASDSHTDKSEGQDINEFEDWEEIQPLHCANSSKFEKGSDGNNEFPIRTGVDSPEDCHKAVRTMHNLSVLLLENSSLSDNLSESDFQILQSVICNISQCLLKSVDVSKSTDVAAFMPDKQLVAANSRKTEKDCYAAEKREDPVGARSSQISAKVYHSQMAKFEVELNSIESEFRRLRTELERKDVRKTHAGTHKNRHIETLANRDEFYYTCAPFSEERSQELPDLNLDPIVDDESVTDDRYIKKNEDNAISQNNISEEPILRSSLSTIEDYFGIIRDNIGNNLLDDCESTESPIDVYEL